MIEHNKQPRSTSPTPSDVRNTNQNNKSQPQQPPEPAVGPALELSAAELEALHSITVRLERRWTLPIPESSVFHVYDPLPWAYFLPGIRTAMEYTKGKRFLDIGCGIGTKLAFMYTLGFKVAGFDIYAHYIESAGELVREAELQVANVLDIEHFDADIVYMYRPGVSDEIEANIEKHVASRLVPGTVFYLPVRQLDPSLGLKQVAKEIWVK